MKINPDDLADAWAELDENTVLVTSDLKRRNGVPIAYADTDDPDDDLPVRKIRKPRS